MNKTIEERATQLIDTPKCLLVEVPERSKNFQIDQNWLVFDPWYPARGGAVVKDNMIKLPPGSYGQPILASEMTTVQKMEYVKTGIAHGERWYHDYEFSTKRLNLSYGTADESFASLLRSHNLQPSTTVVIPKTI